MPIQWMIIVPDEAEEGLVDLLNNKITAAVQIASNEYPVDEIKFSVLEFHEVEIC